MVGRMWLMPMGPAVVFTSYQNTQVLSLAALSKRIPTANNGEPATVQIQASSKAIHAGSSGTQVPKVLGIFFVASMLTYAFDVMS